MFIPWTGIPGRGVQFAVMLMLSRHRLLCHMGMTRAAASLRPGAIFRPGDPRPQNLCPSEDLCFGPQPIPGRIRENLYVDVAGSLLLLPSAEGIGISQSKPEQLQIGHGPLPFAVVGAPMSKHDRVDRKSFQSLLANAFSVQQSGMTPQSLSSIIEIQRTISKDDIAID